MDNKLAEESKRVQLLRDKLRAQLDRVEQQVAQRSLKSKNIRLKGPVAHSETALRAGINPKIVKNDIDFSRH